MSGTRRHVVKVTQHERLVLAWYRSSRSDVQRVLDGVLFKEAHTGEAVSKVLREEKAVFGGAGVPWKTQEQFEGASKEFIGIVPILSSLR